VAAPSPRASLGRRTVCGRTEQRRPPVSKRYETQVRMVWGSFLIAAAAPNTPTRNGSTSQGVNLTLTLKWSDIFTTREQSHALRYYRKGVFTLEIGLYKTFFHLFVCARINQSFIYKTFFHLFVCARINQSFITPAHLHYPHFCNTYARLLLNI